MVSYQQKVMFFVQSATKSFLKNNISKTSRVSTGIFFISKLCRYNIYKININI